ncbi:hypothetical protein TTHERM_00923090 (macronuclear) [Tetrahymena thermophila SB210]|uniref:Uncharacterized protein n=1 Tax=Tetrahymena thermophila (strain SB210) TaxID=312017 RepID=Q23WN6_TETTS|nr:hypothetical protein TTHERM_00923090 [Tetrahymena thermophila SB210]EAS00944.2 hypothetical protein TTHERM_00923090 [Tetrahymena thermophila SB210]|eukprot:XP_001021189.2 hypothetical protein TTHERM_00923090 [Tetrahymena thermophila SB210]
MAESNRSQYEQNQLSQLAQRILPETSKIFWILQRIDYDRQKSNHDHDLQTQIITVDTVIIFARSVYQTTLDGQKAYNILQMLDGLKIGMLNKESFNQAIAIKLRELFGEIVYKMSFQLQSEIKVLHIIIANIFMANQHPLNSQLTDYIQKKQSLNIIAEFIHKLHLQPLENKKEMSDEIFDFMQQINLILENLAVNLAIDTNENNLQAICKLLSYQLLSIDQNDMSSIADFMNIVYQKMSDYNFFNLLMNKIGEFQYQNTIEYTFLIQILRLILCSGRVYNQNFNGEKFVVQFLENYPQVFTFNFVTNLIINCQFDQLEVQFMQQTTQQDSDEEFLLQLEMQVKQKQNVRQESLQILLYLCKYHSRFRKYLVESTDYFSYQVQNLSLIDEFSLCLVSYIILEISQQELIEKSKTVNYAASNLLAQQLLFFGQNFLSLNVQNHPYFSEILFNGIDIVNNSLFLLQYLPGDIDKIFELIDNLFKSTNEDIQSRVLRIFKNIIDSSEEKLKLKFITQSRLDIIYFELQKQESPLRMQCLSIIKSLINSGMIIETLHSHLINTLIKNKYSDEENIFIMQIFRTITEKQKEFVLIGMLENGLLEKISKVVLESFSSFKLDSLNEICIYENPYLSFDFFIDYISIIQQIALNNKNNKFESFLKESFFKNLHSIFQMYFENKQFCLMTINQKIEITINQKSVSHRLAYVILDLMNHFQTTCKNNLIIESLISRLSNQFNYEIYKIYQLSQIDNIPINVMIEVKFIEIIPIDLNTTLGDKFKVSKDITYTDFMRFIQLNFQQGKYSFKIKNIDDNTDIEDDQSLQKSIKKAMEVKIQSDEKMFSLRIRIIATPVQQQQQIANQQIYIDYLQQQWPHANMVYGGQRIPYPPQLQQPQQILQNRYLVFCKICKGTFQSYGQIVSPCLLCNNFIPNQFSYQAIPTAPNIYTAFPPQIQQPQIAPQLLPVQALPQQLQLAYSPINASSKSKTQLSSPYKLD